MAPFTEYFVLRIILAGTSIISVLLLCTIGTTVHLHIHIVSFQYVSSYTVSCIFPIDDQRNYFIFPDGLFKHAPVVVW